MIPGSEFFNRDTNPVAGPDLVTLGDVDVEPEFLVVMRGHQAVFLIAELIVHVIDDRFKFQNFCHDKKGKRKNVQIARGVTIQVVLLE